MKTLEDLAREAGAKRCWPTPWLEAAMKAGLAHHKGGGEWVFINDKLRDMLESFAGDIAARARAQALDEAAEACDKQAAIWLPSSSKRHEPEACASLIRALKEST